VILIGQQPYLKPSDYFIVFAPPSSHLVLPIDVLVTRASVFSQSK
jgi:hypothetical protein